jgi:hypothetical protein
VNNLYATVRYLKLSETQALGMQDIFLPFRCRSLSLLHIFEGMLLSALSSPVCVVLFNNRLHVVGEHNLWLHRILFVHDHEASHDVIKQKNGIWQFPALATIICSH